MERAGFFYTESDLKSGFYHDFKHAVCKAARRRGEKSPSPFSPHIIQTPVDLSIPSTTRLPIKKR